MNGNEIKVRAKPAANGSYRFQENAYGVRADKIDGRVAFKKVGPYLGMGWGNAVPSTRVGVLHFRTDADAGAGPHGRSRYLVNAGPADHRADIAVRLPGANRLNNPVLRVAATGALGGLRPIHALRDQEKLDIAQLLRRTNGMAVLCPDIETPATGGMRDLHEPLRLAHEIGVRLDQAKQIVGGDGHQHGRRADQHRHDKDIAIRLPVGQPGHGQQRDDRPVVGQGVHAAAGHGGHPV